MIKNTPTVCLSIYTNNFLHNQKFISLCSSSQNPRTSTSQKIWPLLGAFLFPHPCREISAGTNLLPHCDHWTWRASGMLLLSSVCHFKGVPLAIETAIWFGWFLNVLAATRLSRGQIPRLKSDNCMCCHTDTERGDHDFCLSQSHYTDTDPNSRERARGPNP